jgi:hypothetical protein
MLVSPDSRQRSPITRLRAVFLLVAVVVPLACAGLPNPLGTPVLPDGLHPKQPLPVVDPANPAPVDPKKVEELARHRMIWNALQIRDYSLTLIYGCECLLAGRQIVVTVTDAQVVKATDEGGDIPLDHLTGFPATVDALFAYAERNANAGKLEIAWDEQRGYPTAIGVDPDLQARDDEVRVAVIELQPAR